MTDPEIERIMHEKMRRMMTPKRVIIDITDGNFNDILTQNHHVLVDFWAEWCGPCRSMHPVFEDISKTYEHIQFARMNVDQNSLVPAKYSVQSIPTFILFCNGTATQRLTGAVSPTTLHTLCRGCKD